ncbi:MAG: transcription elongation factor GreA [Phycisphaeraceae bacterium]|nr:transcription elongation factor GreA [Phycisphaeraceae bacterium]MCW5754725.1 transcription elongation factor GreA [Phycisphaeraceae bacterium]
MEIITKQERETLEARLRALYENRQVLTTRIQEARELGDLKENAEYHAARELQGQEEAEIRRLEDRLAKVQVVEGGGASKEAGVVFLGSIVKLREEGSDEDELYRLVGEASGDMDSEYIEVTVSSPMGEALMKASVGETIAVRAPRGVKRFLIVELL